MKINYVVTAVNENTIHRLLKVIWATKRASDKIWILFDDKFPTYNSDVQSKWNFKDVSFLVHPLKWDFAAHRNYIHSLIKNDEYICMIDADEMIDVNFCDELYRVLVDTRPNLLKLPRINMYTDAENEMPPIEWDNLYQYLGYPDQQSRVYKLTPGSRWVNKIHEQLVCSPPISYATQNELHLRHVKSVARQDQQNKFYQEFK